MLMAYLELLLLVLESTLQNLGISQSLAMHRAVLGVVHSSIRVGRWPTIRLNGVLHEPCR